MHKPLFPELIDVVIHIGAGRCENVVEQFTRIGVRQVALFEADFELYEQLITKFEHEPTVNVVNAAVTGVNDVTTSTLNRYNLSRLNSLRRVSGATALFPGLQNEQPASVQTLPILKILEETGVTFEGLNCLLIQAAGEEFSILESLQVQGRLDDFQYICVEAGREPLFQGSKSISEIADWFAAHEFTPDGELFSNDPAIPFLRFRHTLQTQRGGVATDVVNSEELQNRIESVSADLRVALRTQNMLQNDLHELQVRYADLHGEKEDQDSLLIQVTERLSAASNYIRQLNVDNSDQLKGLLGAGASDRTTTDADE